MKTASLLTTPELAEHLKALLANGCEIKKDGEAGTATAHDGETVVLKAIQKYRGGPWIAMFHDSDRITWNKPEGR
jgi:hypothetical protein